MSNSLIFPKYNSALAEELSEDFRTQDAQLRGQFRGENLLTVKSQGHKVDALNPKKQQQRAKARQANRNENAQSQGGPDTAAHPLLPNMEGMSPDQVVIPEDVKAEQTFGASKLAAKNRHEKKQKLKMPAPKPKQRLVNAPKYRSPPPKPRPPGR